MTKKLLAILLAAAFLLPALSAVPVFAAPFTRGDVDGDGNVSSADARLALRGSVGLEELSADFIMRADVDANGKVESSDARTILRASVNLDVIAANDCEHEVESWTAVLQSDGSHAPYHKGVCKRCGETLFADHSFELEITKPFTCTTSGEATETCACGLTGETVTVPAQHTWEEVEGTKTEATCTTDGVVEMRCAVCGKTETQTVPKGHVPGTDATCTEPQRCTRCGEEIAPALGHVYKDDVSVTVTKGIRCDRCGKIVVPGFNDLVNVLKDGTHTYSGFSQTVSTASQPEFTGLMKTMLNMIPKKDRELMLEELTASQTEYTPFVRNNPLTKSNYNLLNENVVSKLTENDVKSVKTERMSGVDFLAELPDVYINSRNKTEDLTTLKNTEIGDVIKVTVVLPTEQDKKDGAVTRIDSNLSQMIEESSDEIGGFTGELDIFGEDAIQLLVNSTTDAVITYYFDVQNNAPIAAHYDEGIKIESKMNLFLNDDGTQADKSTGAINLAVATEIDYFFFFDDYFTLS